MGEHIVKSFDEDLTAIRAKISEMGGLAEELLSGALKSLQERNAELAQTVIRLDKRLDALEIEVEEMSTRVIALRQPMAQDLRLVISTLKLSSALERIGDLSKSTARRGIQLAKTPPAGITNSIVRMGRQALGQLTEVLDAWARHDVEAAIGVWRRDIEIDEAYNSLFREVITYMMEDPGMISVGSQLLFIAKNLERIGDHTTHVAEMIHYVETGTPLGDERPKGEPAGRETE
jgi:phosphate transport system protein